MQNADTFLLSIFLLIIFPSQIFLSFVFKHRGSNSQHIESSRVSKIDTGSLPIDESETNPKPHEGETITPVEPMLDDLD